MAGVVCSFSANSVAHENVIQINHTIADLEDSDQIQPHHLAEAIQYRKLDRKL